LGTPSFGNAIAADLPSLGLSGSGTYDSRHVGTGKAIGYSGLVLSGTAAGNYSLPVTTANGVGAITPLATVAWTGGTTGNWSDLANWAGGALPDGANVTAVSIPSGVSVTFDGTNTASGFLGSANLANLTSLGTLNLSGGTLNVANAFSSYAYNQTGGTYSGTGSFSISNSFLKSGGSFKPTGQVFITQANGNLVVINEAPLVIGSLDVQAGDLEWDNTGGILSNGQIKASGKVSLIARSPISIGAGGIQAGSGVSLSAPTASTGSTISINGAVYSSIGTVAVSGYGDVTLYANVSGGNINIVSSSGSISISPTAVSTVSSGGSISVSAVNGSVTYSGANFSGASPNITSSTFSTAPPAAPAAAPVEQAARQILESDSPEEAPADEVSTVNTMGVIGTGGATLSNFPVAGSSSTVVVSVPAATGGEAGSSAEPVISIVLEVAPRPGPPKLIVNASKSIPRRAGVLNSSELQMLSRQVQEARTQLFSGALSALDKNPEAAEIPDCGSGGGGPCIASRKSLVVAQETYVPVVKRKIALMIGNNAYRSPIPDLETAINDVSAIGEQLRDNLGYEMKVVQNASREAIIEALNDLIRTTERDDSVIVMYAGHGYLKEETKAGYWIPTDAAATSPDKWISNDTIARALGNIPAKQVMLISDSCYSGTLTKEGKVTETVGVSREQTLTQRSVLALSSGGDEPVSDEGYDNHSIFAWNLIRSLKGMSGETTGTQLHSVIKTEVTKEFPQEPQYGTVVSAGHSVGGEYLFTPKRSGN
jgi:hypothetical protein